MDREDQAFENGSFGKRVSIWGEALSYEHISLSMTAVQMAAAKNPAEYFRKLMERRAPENLVAPTPAETTAFDNLMKAAEAALREPPEAAAPRLRSLQDEVQKGHPFYREVTPSFVKVNDARKEVLVARQKLLSALSAK